MGHPMRLELTRVGLLVKVANHYTTSAHNYVCNFDFVPRIWSRLHDKDYLYILSSSKNSFSPFGLTESTHSLTFRLPAVNPAKIYTFCHLFLSYSAFSVRLIPASNTASEKRQTTNMGEDTFLQGQVAIFLYVDTLYEILSLHTF